MNSKLQTVLISFTDDERYGKKIHVQVVFSDGGIGSISQSFQSLKEAYEAIQLHYSSNLR